MVKDLKEQLGAEDSETLFFILKHDESVDFDKKLMAGRILYERNYDSAKLKEEKQLIIKSIQQRVRAYEDETLQAARNKKVVVTEILFSFAYVSLFLFIGLWQNIMNKEPVEWLPIVVLALLTSAFILYKVGTFKRRLKTLHDTDTKDRDLLKCKMYRISNEWNF
ncbi:MAG: hypothetical protein JW783_03715 [Bacteroidales bacterium]|nr:hypothetical protein [Bacteroidales bacterium]MBN2751024.1 hypothetical protein [Bacteroidales bacterium]